MNGVFSGARFLWAATSGHRLRPWKSEYLRWRMETYTGKKAETLRLRDFVGLFFAERAQMFRFFRWTGAMQVLAQGKKVD